MTNFQQELTLILNTDTLPLKPKKKQCGKKFASYGHKCKPHSEEAKKLISEALKGKPKSEEHRRKLSEARKLYLERKKLTTKQEIINNEEILH